MPLQLYFVFPGILFLWNVHTAKRSQTMCLTEGKEVSGKKALCSALPQTMSLSIFCSYYIWHGLQSLQFTLGMCFACVYAFMCAYVCVCGCKCTCVVCVCACAVRDICIRVRCMCLVCVCECVYAVCVMGCVCMCVWSGSRLLLLFECQHSAAAPYAGRTGLPFPRNKRNLRDRVAQLNSP